MSDVVTNGNCVYYRENFFKGSELMLKGQHKFGAKNYNLYELLSEKYFIRKRKRKGSKFVGEIDGIVLELNGGNRLIRKLDGLLPGMERDIRRFSGKFYLKYYPISIETGEKTYGLSGKIPLIFSEPPQILRLFSDEKHRKSSSEKCFFRLPLEYFLVEPRKS